MDFQDIEPDVKQVVKAPVEEVKPEIPEIKVESKSGKINIPLITPALDLDGIMNEIQPVTPTIIKSDVKKVVEAGGTVEIK